MTDVSFYFDLGCPDAYLSAERQRRRDLSCSGR
ncbi:MAG: hypothetical protein QOE67_1564 [Solirubrobacteraceae bacterium]|jgi:2-hydroxychromene-2-carboxylate isomerase|nr:hypothetical protein [Solirubrobacteraceae bacterium]